MRASNRINCAWTFGNERERLTVSDFDKPATTVLSVGNRAVAVEVRGFLLEVMSGPDAGKSAQAKGRSLEVGTHASADLVLTDEHVSRRHLRVDVGKSDCVLVDLGSTNGTRVGGVRVRVAPLDDGAIIECGGSKLRFSFTAAPVRVALAERDDFEGLLGRSVAMRELFALLDRVAPTDAPVLIQGETGTGKERVARALHARSRRAGRPFAVFDCAAVPPTLIEAELFGHEKGAFTGATERRAGVFERADGGTVFLDELGELAIELQPKLLRVLESNEVFRVGASKPTPIDARIVAATNRDLGARISEGQFREDLYYRLAVVTVSIPPLRERRDDIPLLASHFAREHVFAGEQSSASGAGLEGDLRLHDHLRFSRQRARAAQHRRARGHHVGSEAPCTAISARRRRRAAQTRRAGGTPSRCRCARRATPPSASISRTWCARPTGISIRAATIAEVHHASRSSACCASTASSGPA